METVRPRGAQHSVIGSPIIPDPVDAKPFEISLPDPDTLVVGMVGRLTPWKGQDVFVRAGRG